MSQPDDAPPVGDDPISTWLIRRGLPAVVLAACALALATWAPHYLAWPWWPDLDSFAGLARGWEAGERPYRDVVVFNFPGHIYLFWVLGKLFGWGGTVPVYAVDLAFLVGSGAVFLAWSRRAFGGPLPGAIAYLGTLSYYLSLDFSEVAQRDWHAPMLAVLGLMAAQGWPGRRGRLAMAAAFAAAATIRPHVVLFAPAIVLMIDATTRPQGGPWRLTVRATARWLVALAAFTALAFSPLIASGLMDDLFRGLTLVRPGAGYSTATWRDAAKACRDELYEPSAWASGLGLMLGAWLAPRPAWRAGLPWLAALAAMAFYRPLHPVPHDYLMHPFLLLAAVGLAPTAHAVLRRRDLTGPWKVLAVALLGFIAMPATPKYCSVSRTKQAIALWRRGEAPPFIPFGMRPKFAPGKIGPYPLDDYRAALRHLDRTTPPTTRVANVLLNIPFPPLNGPLGRLGVFPADTGVVWLWSVDPSREGDFVRALEATPDSVVVWSPEEPERDPKLDFPALKAAVRRLYEPEARFGRIEVWRRRPAGTVAGR